MFFWILLKSLLPARVVLVIWLVLVAIGLVWGIFLLKTINETPDVPLPKMLQSIAADLALTRQADSQIAMYSSWSKLPGAHRSGDLPNDTFVRQSTTAITTFNGVNRQLRELSQSMHNKGLVTATRSLGVTIAEEGDALARYAKAVESGGTPKVEQAWRSLRTAGRETESALGRYELERNVIPDIEITPATP